MKNGLALQNQTHRTDLIFSIWNFPAWNGERIICDTLTLSEFKTQPRSCTVYGTPLKNGEIIIKRKNWIVWLVLVFLFVLFNGIRLFNANEEKAALMEDTVVHLEAAGYDTEMDIDEMHIVNIGVDETIHAVVVIFTNESDTHYLYTYEEDADQIMQLDSVTSNPNQTPKHQES